LCKITPNRGAILCFNSVFSEKAIETDLSGGHP
jgi:hypothetical protein